jgi:hypothetical protein
MKKPPSEVPDFIGKYLPPVPHFSPREIEIYGNGCQSQVQKSQKIKGFSFGLKKGWKCWGSSFGKIPHFVASERGLKAVQATNAPGSHTFTKCSGTAPSCVVG